ncbi:MAG: hypothetical protein JNG83_08170 [Opitutaceae bacterium]|nr:hypothetical protein [Opitutaceae bacterium]
MIRPSRHAAPEVATSGKRLVNRREFLACAGWGAGGLLLTGGRAGPRGDRRPRVAAVVTEVSFRRHGHVFLENFVEPYLFDGRWIRPPVVVVSLYVDQFPEDDLAREFSHRYGVPIYPTIAGALCQGGQDLAVDAVLVIGEHGRYPTNARGQVEWPRKRFFDEVVAVFRQSGRVVPLFNDKHLSHRWDWAREMYETATRLGIPFMAGSSVPLAQRIPPLELPTGGEMLEAIALHGGRVESYDFHALEVLQSFVEARRGGESGIAEVRFLAGEDLWRAAAAGEWTPSLAEAALAAGGWRPEDAGKIRPDARGGRDGSFVSHGLLLRYRDGLKGLVLGVGTGGSRWSFACRLAGEADPRATSLYPGPWSKRNLFKALAHAIQAHFESGRAPYPVERTLLVTGILDAEMESRAEDGRPVATPHLDIRYPAPDLRPWRESGASWRILTEEVPEPRGLEVWRGP